MAIGGHRQGMAGLPVASACDNEGRMPQETIMQDKAQTSGKAGSPSKAKLVQPDHRRHRRLGGRDRPGGARPGGKPRQAVLRRLDRVRRRAQRHVSLVDAAMPGMLPVINEECIAQAVRTGLGLNAAINLTQRLRPQELLLSGPAAGLPDQPVQAADRRRGRRSRSTSTARRSRSASSGCIWSRTPASRSTTSTRTIRSSISTAPASR